MLATLGGILALLAGLVVLLIPLLLPELSRPRDAFWGALVLLLGLVLVTSAERLSGAPMLAVLCGGLLIGRLGSEVSLGRWRQLSGEEQQRFWSPERWQTSLLQLRTAAARLLRLVVASLGGAAAWLQQRATAKPKTPSKRWVRPEESTAPAPTQAPVPAATQAPAVVEVRSFTEIDELLQQVAAPAGPLPSVAGAGEEADQPAAVSAEPEAEGATIEA
ncbi:hypothetical protein KQ306_03130 [Synechococcus sp. CS-1324]|uniref:Ycf66 family protein n=1 Tax=Synechococcus sp. CS-1324 TaxID=2847980 RepID=UPI000DB0939A|nr:Ycf66 family protein [Synechococcus sp. CS-1324]MCT0229857.1 hypothetical protein [Synechococcus sp. CS-1324]PZV05335.1 MAG: hypothetical protein DCF23_03460 [Cyanobium sp.]